MHKDEKQQLSYSAANSMNYFLHSTSARHY